MGRGIGRVVRGVVALVGLLVLVGAVPVFLLRTVGNPWPGRDAIELRDEQAILLGVLAAAAWIVWARFVVAVGIESVLQIRQLGSARAGSGVSAVDVAAAPPRVPAGGGLGLLAARLVAVALTLIPAAPIAAPGTGPLPFRPAPLATAMAGAPVSASIAVPAPPSTAGRQLPAVEVQGNESLFRLAERHLGERGRWREILDLNVDRVQPDGGRLTTPSSLRSGWTLVLPADAVVGARSAPATALPTGVTARDVPAAAPQAPVEPPAHVVAPGESYWAIAAGQLRSELGRRPTAIEISARAERLITANAARLGHADPTMLHPGDTLVVEPAAPVLEPPSTYVVEPGDSYWEIAEEHLELTLGRTPSDAEVLAATDALVEANAPLFEYADPAMVYPGDEVVVPPVRWPAPEQPVGEATPADDAAPPLAEGRPPVPPRGGVQPADTAPAPPDEAPPDPPVSTPAAEVAPVPPPPTTPRPPEAPTVPAVSVPGEGGSLGPSRGEAVPITGPPDTTEPDYGELLGTPESPGRNVAVPLGIGGAVVLAGGVMTILDARRRAALRRAQARARLAPVATTPTELRLRALDAPARLVRLDLALRALAAGLRGQRTQPAVLLVHRDGAVACRLTAEAALGQPWSAADDGWWTLPGTVTEEELAVLGRSAGLPCPAVVHLGSSAGADVYVDLEAIGVLDIDAPDTAAGAIIDAIALGLAVSPFASGATLTMVGVDERIAEARPDLEFGFDVERATATARTMIGTIGAATSMGTSTFALRARSTVERWEPVVVLLGSGVDAGDDLRSLAQPGGRGVALVTAAASSSGPSLRRDDAGGWTLSPWGIPIEPVGIDPQDVAAVIELLDEAEVDLLLPPEPVDPPDPEADAAEFEDRDWELLVRVLGGVRVHDGAGTDVRFERSKAQELVCWLALHRAGATRTAARTALWDADVRDSTFANVVSDARRNMARLVAPPEGQEWVGRTLTEALPLHPLVVTDADLLADRVAAARGQSPTAAIALLRPGLALVTDLPFAGTGYLWPDSEGTVTELILLGTTAAVEMAEHCLAAGDVEGVFWATGQGLRILPGHEELVALRMRAHARAGDLAAVRAEWGSYERALAADPWSDAEPATKLVELRRELLGPATADLD